MDRSFIKRLVTSCDEAGIPGPNRGRFQNLAGQLGVSHTAVCGWFTGRSRPRYDRIEMLATILNVDPMWLGFGRELGVAAGDVPVEWIHAATAGVTSMLLFNNWSVAAGTRDGEVLAVKSGRSRRIHPATAKGSGENWTGVIDARAWADEEVETPLVCFVPDRPWFFDTGSVKTKHAVKRGPNVILSLAGTCTKRACVPTVGGSRFTAFDFA